jgi:biotin/methionine sulfoxide reductase
MIMLEDFRRDPVAYPLKTPSGKIEIFSETIAGFGYEDCPGHPAWLEPLEWLGNTEAYPLHMISNQPRDKLHSQLDHGPISQSGRLDGREPCLMNIEDAVARGLVGGQLVRIFNGPVLPRCSSVTKSCKASFRLPPALGLIQKVILALTAIPTF